MRFLVRIEIPEVPNAISRAELLAGLENALDHSTAREALREALGCEVRLETAEDAVAGFFATIEATGGVTRKDEGWYVPVADEAWIDLGEAYIAACAAFDRQPMVVTENDVQIDRGVVYSVEPLRR